ncbi:MAG: hypothetical protein ACRCZB_01175 [Bacteroidales bacterium]
MLVKRIKLYLKPYCLVSVVVSANKRYVVLHLLLSLHLSNIKMLIHIAVLAVTLKAEPKNYDS